MRKNIRLSCGTSLVIRHICLKFPRANNLTLLIKQDHYQKRKQKSYRQVTNVIVNALSHCFLCRKNIIMKKLLEYNLSFVDIFMRYAIILVLGILFGVTQFYPLIVLAVIVFISAVTGVCPIYGLLGINHAPGRQAH